MCSQIKTMHLKQTQKIDLAYFINTLANEKIVQPVKHAHQRTRMYCRYSVSAF